MYINVSVDINDIFSEMEDETLIDEMEERGLNVAGKMEDDAWYRLNTNGENLFELLEQQFCHEVGYTPERLKQIIANGIA